MKEKNRLSGVSIIICCYNSAKRITATLEHIYKQEISQTVDWEVIIVNNNSSDDTEKIVNQIGSQYFDIVETKIVNQPIPGLSNARKKGLESAKYDCIVFCDDDNWLSTKYVATAFSIMNTNDQIGVLAGAGVPVSNVNLPIWFTTYQRYYAIGALNYQSGDVSSRGDVWGAGMVIRYSDYKRLIDAGFDFLLTGRKGNALSGGEDTEMCKWFLISGKKLWYDDRLVFQHFIEPHRLSINYVENLIEENIVQNEIINKYNVLLMKTSSIKLVWRILKSIIIYLMTGDHRLLKLSKSYLELCNFVPKPIFDREFYSIKKAKEKLQKNKK
jgi:glycosyltransferase involved in cell wall biosynthesis